MEYYSIIIFSKGNVSNSTLMAFLLELQLLLFKEIIQLTFLFQSPV